MSEQLATLPRDHSIVVHCGSGYRSAIAASLLQREGYPDVADLVGGMTAWQASARVEPVDP
ncbi:MAG: rhodanese-like domain-containing protein [Solirubrobacterales bacterium]|nr:rhodanese-like domain-containing protein [Solirubrobacterales bacterium]